MSESTQVSAPLRSMDGSGTGVYEFDGSELAGSINKQLLHDAVVMYQANQRQGSAKTKTRGEVTGSSKKLFRQKGTGNARMGTKRSPIRRGGGHTFAKQPKDWSYRLPKKALRLATRMALLSKFRDDEAVVVEDLSVAEPKTRAIFGLLKALELQGQSCLLVIPEHDINIWRSGRNIEGLLVCTAADLNAFVLLRQKRLVICREAIDQLRERQSQAMATAS